MNHHALPVAASGRSQFAGSLDVETMLHRSPGEINQPKRRDAIDETRERSV